MVQRVGCVGCGQPNHCGAPGDGGGQNGTRFVPMVAQIKPNTGRQARELSSDADYSSEANFRELNRRHIRGYVATGRQQHGHALYLGIVVHETHGT